MAKSRNITTPRDREYSACPRPPTEAGRGESGRAYLPMRCSLSDSTPALCSSFDSGEPRWTSQTVAKRNRKNCRYSDCQFSATSTANRDVVR
jgi:hypothetical protein